MGNEPESQSIDTPAGKVQTTRTVVDSGPQQINPVNKEIIEQFRLLAASAERFAVDHQQSLADSDLKALDEAFRLWQNAANSTYSNEQVMNILGAYLGEKLTKDLNMEWVVVVDEYGTDYAVRGVEFEVMSFPFATVWKRIEDKQHDFLYGVYYAVKHLLSDTEAKRR